MSVTFLVGILMGSVIGSYLGVLVDRFGTRLIANAGRSHCGMCGQQLGFFDLVPLFSYLMLGGRCRYCRKLIGGHVFLIELAGALGGGLILGRLGFDWEGLGLALAFWVSLVILLIDIRHYLIPDIAVLWLTGAACLVWVAHPTMVINGLLGASVGAGFLGILVAITRGKGMGLGDVKLAIPLGLLLGLSKTIIGLWLAFILGSLVGLGLLASRRRGWRDAIPFGPFLLVGAGLAMIWGDRILAWYQRLRFF